MIQVTGVLLLVGTCLSLAAAQCDLGIIGNILAGGAGDDGQVMEVLGKHDVVYVSKSSSVPEGYDNETCVSATYYTKDGKYFADHNGLQGGTYELVWFKDHQVSLNPETGEALRNIFVVDTSEDYNITAYYICSVSGPPVSQGSIAVAHDLLYNPDTPLFVTQLKDTLASVGLGEGVTLFGCYNSKCKKNND